MTRISIRGILRTGLLQIPLLAAVAAAEPVGLNVQANRTQVYFGESFTLQVVVTGAESPTDPDISAIKFATVRGLGSRSESRISMSYVNGRASRETVVRRISEYEIMPAKTGDFTAGPVLLKIGTQTYTHPGPAIRVLGVEAQDHVKLTVQASRESVLVEEPFEITLSIVLQQLPAGFADVDPLYPSSPPRITADFLEQQAPEGLEGPNMGQILQQRLVQGRRAGFAINNYQIDTGNFPFFGLQDPANRAAVFRLDRTAITDKGTNCFQYTLPIRYIPKREGTYTFGPVIFKGSVAVGIDNRGQPLEDQVYAIGPAVTVRVIPPPQEGRPPTFIGVISSNLHAEASLDAQTCRVGDSLTLTLTLSGDANFENMTPPTLGDQTSLTRLFRVYDDTVQSRTLEGKRQFTYTMRPIAAGTIELPPIEIAYYDTRTRRYETARTTVLPLRVNETTQVSSESIIDTGQQIAPQVPMQRGWAIGPLLYSPLGAVHTPLAPAPWQITLLLAPMLAMALFTLYRQATPRIRHVLAKRHTRGALGRTLQKLETARDSAAIYQALSFYLADRFHHEGGTLTPADARQLLEANLSSSAAGLPPAAASLLKAIEHHFNAQYTHASAKANPSPVDTPALIKALGEVDVALKSAVKT